MSEPPDFLLFLGRFHPLLVHLPIGLIVVVAFLELLARRPSFKNATASTGYILTLAAIGSVVTVLCGWLLALGGGYDNRLLGWHRWTGIAVCAAIVIAAVAYHRGHRRLYGGVVLASVLALLVTSHFGGSLTHGSNYLVEYAPGPLKGLLGSVPAAAANEQSHASLRVYPDAIQPVLTKYCVGCHGPEKAKGRLRLDSHDALMKGGESGVVIVGGNPDQSPLLKRLLLPVAHEDHMPPEGKPQPAADDLKLIEWWIASGAQPAAAVELAGLPPAVRKILEPRFAAAPAAVGSSPPLPRAQALELAGKLSAELEIPVSPLSENEPWLHANGSIAGTNFGDAHLTRLQPLAHNLQGLDLGGTGITDAGLAAVSSMGRLKRLALPRTRITDAGLSGLTRLEHLEYLNLYGTAVTDAAIPALKQLPALKQVYLWQTGVTPEGAKQLASARVDERQLRDWNEQIELLQAKIREANIHVDLGTTVTQAVAALATNAAPVNTNCPVSGKAVKSSTTLLHEGRLVAFCCDDCKQKFKDNPTPFLLKAGLASTNSVNKTL